MKEFESNVFSWREQLEQVNFYDTRKGDITEGTQVLVYSRPDLDFAVKVPKEPIWMQGYWLVEELAPELAVPFKRVEDVSLNISRRRVEFPRSYCPIEGF
jgi:hypothetical protein